MSYFSVVLQQIIYFVIYALIGAIAIRGKVLSRDSLDALSRFITRILLPLYVFTNTINSTTREDLLGSLNILWLTVLFYLVTYLVALGLRKAMKLQGDRGNVYHACTMFGNNGFMGIPLIAALFPEGGMLFVALFTVTDQIILWSVGTSLTLPSEGNARPGLMQRMKKIINPAMIGILLSVVFVLLRIRLPEAVNTALTKTGGMTGPMAMIYLGGVFMLTDIRPFLRKKEIYATVLVKMVLLPIPVYYLLKLLPFVSTETAICFGVLAGLPTMSTIAMMAQVQHSDGDYAAGMIFMTTLFSVVTLPLICFAFGG